MGGDSWGCGEWGHDTTGKYLRTHKGLEEYLENDGYIVKNTSEGASSNKNAIQRLKENLNYDLIFWFQTDPLRDYRPYTNFYETFVEYNDFKKASINNLIESYELLNSFNKQIYCIGGCSKLDTNLMKDYTNLIPLIPSIPEFLLNDYVHPEFWQSDWCYKVSLIKNIKTLEILLENKKKQWQLKDKKYLNFFGPDGEHANRHGYLEIYKFIKKTILTV